MSTEQVIFLVVHSGKTEISKVGYGSAGHSSTGVGGQLAEVEGRIDRVTRASPDLISSEVDQEMTGGKPISRFTRQPALF
jgi:hypothetical protein